MPSTPWPETEAVSAPQTRVNVALRNGPVGQPDRGIPLLEKATQVAAHDGKYRQLAEARQLLRELTEQP